MMLLTPPDTRGAFHLAPLSSMSSVMYGAPAPTSRYELDGPDYDEGFTRSAFRYDPPAPYPASTDSGLRPSTGRVTSVPSALKTFHPNGIPVLPPIRVPDAPAEEYRPPAHFQRAPSAGDKKEEKVGGVTAHLDYNMEEMVNFVAEMTQGMYAIFLSKICLADIDLTRSVLSSDAPAHPTFRKFVSQVLTSTRLPSSTILGGLHYLAVRMTMLSGSGNHNFVGGDLYNLLITALLLGSKFLDDNTFQNRSWSDVSNIPVPLLNKMESDWLMDIKWDLHFDPCDPKGFGLWRRRWETYRVRSVDALAESMKQACLDGRLQRPAYSSPYVPPQSQHQSAFPLARSSNMHPERPVFSWQSSRIDRWMHGGPVEYSPPSAPETGPTTPDCGISGGLGYNNPFPATYLSHKLPPAMVGLPPNGPASGFTSPYKSFCNQQAAYGNFCYCQYCTLGNDRYVMGPRFHQSVVG